MLSRACERCLSLLRPNLTRAPGNELGCKPALNIQQHGVRFGRGVCKVQLAGKACADEHVVSLRGEAREHHVSAKPRAGLPHVEQPVDDCAVQAANIRDINDEVASHTFEHSANLLAYALKLQGRWTHCNKACKSDVAFEG